MYIRGLYSALSNVWTVGEKLQNIKVQQSSLDKVLSQNVPQWRAELLTSAKPQQVQNTLPEWSYIYACLYVDQSTIRPTARYIHL